MGVNANAKEAVRWFRRAANHSNSNVLCMMGKCYELGAGVETNIRQAVKWYKLAIARGNTGTKAVDRLNTLIATGRCVEIEREAERPF